MSGQRDPRTAQGRVLLPSAQEAVAALGAGLLSLGAGFGVRVWSDLGDWLGVVLLLGGVVLVVVGLRHAVALQRHYDEGGRVGAGARIAVWLLATVAGAGGLAAALLLAAELVALVQAGGA